MPFLALLFLLVLPTSASPGTADSPAAAPAGVEGYWKAPSGAVVRVLPCGRDMCLKIVKLSPIIPARTDIHNPESKLRSRLLCSLDIGTGFRQVDANHLTDGHVYDPESGHTYNGTISTDGDQMKLRGYIAITLLGRTETWYRAPAVQESDCR
jgi:uncharacterized protein (DUF2147 family)